MKQIILNEPIRTVPTDLQVPPGRTQVEQSFDGDVSGTIDHYYTIPVGEQITIQRLKAGAEYDQSKVGLYYAPNGDLTGLVLIEPLYVGNNSQHSDLFYTSPPGDGTAAILLRRIRLTGGNYAIFGKWEGYY